MVLVPSEAHQEEDENDNQPLFGLGERENI